MVKTDAVERWGMPREHGDGGEYVETVTLDDVRAVFGEVRGPVVLSADVADALGCSRETARRKLGALYDQGEVDRRKVSRRVLYWKDRDGDAPTMDDGLPSGPGDVRRDSVGEDAARADAGDDATEPPADPPTDAHGADTAPEEDALDAVDRVADSWEGTDDQLEARKAAARAVLDYAREHGTVSKQEAKKNIRPEYPVEGQNARTWYRKTIRPVLNEAAEYDQSARAYRLTDAEGDT